MPIPVSQEPPPWFLKLPPPIWMFAFLIAAFAVDRILDVAPVPYLSSVAAAALLSLAGLAIAVWGRLGFAAAGTEIIPTSPANKVLVTNGAFRISRNPMYLGLVLITAGIAFYRGTLPFFAVPILLFLLCNAAFIPYEENKMQRQFGDQYADYRRRVRRWL